MGCVASDLRGGGGGTACSAAAGGSPSGGSLALHFAAWHGNLSRVVALLAEGASVNSVDKDGWTPLHFAVRSGCCNCLAALVAAGADVNARAKGGQTALQWAALAGSAECVAALLAAGASVDAVDSAGRTALHEAALRGHAACIAALVAAQAAVEAQDSWGHTPLYYLRQKYMRQETSAEHRAQALAVEGMLLAGQRGPPLVVPSLPEQAGTVAGMDSGLGPDTEMTTVAAAADAGHASDSAGGGPTSLRPSNPPVGVPLGPGSAIAPACTHSSSSSNNGGDGGRECRVCLEAGCELLAFIPCGHRATCLACAQRLMCQPGGCRCPVCRSQVGAWLRVYDC